MQSQVRRKSRERPVPCRPMQRNGGNGRRVWMRLLVAALLVCETRQGVLAFAFRGGWAPRSAVACDPVRPRGTVGRAGREGGGRGAGGGARALTCGFRDALRKLNPFSKSRAVEARRQWDELKGVGSPQQPPAETFGGDMPAPPPFPAQPAYKARMLDPLEANSRTSRLRQELDARDAERQRVWSAPVPTGAAEVVDAQAPTDGDSEADRHRRQAAAEADIERVLGKRILQQREFENKQPEFEQASRREMAERAKEMQADMDRTLGRRPAGADDTAPVSAIRRQPLPVPSAAAPKRGLSLRDLTNAKKGTNAAQAQTAKDGDASRQGSGKVGQRPDGLSASDASDAGADADAPRAPKTFAEETAAMTAGKTVGDVQAGVYARGESKAIPKSAWALPKYVTKRVSNNQNLTPAQQQQGGRHLGGAGPTPPAGTARLESPTPPPANAVAPPGAGAAPAGNLSLRDLQAAAARREEEGGGVGGEEDAAAADGAGGAAGQEPPRPSVTKAEEANAALLRSLSRRRTPAPAASAAPTDSPPTPPPPPKQMQASVAARAFAASVTSKVSRMLTQQPSRQPRQRYPIPINI